MQSCTRYGHIGIGRVLLERLRIRQNPYENILRSRISRSVMRVVSANPVVAHISVWRTGRRQYRSEGVHLRNAQRIRRLAGDSGSILNPWNPSGIRMSGHECARKRLSSGVKHCHMYPPVDEGQRVSLDRHGRYARVREVTCACA